MNNDLINFSFQIIFTVCIWCNVLKLFKDKSVRGVSLIVSLFYCLAPIWTAYYFFALKQDFSIISSLLMFSGNSTWLILALYYRYKPNYLSIWDYGTCETEHIWKGKTEKSIRPARKHRITGAVQFVLWKVGDKQGDYTYTEDFWIDYDSSWWKGFKKFA